MKLKAISVILAVLRAIGMDAYETLNCQITGNGYKSHTCIDGRKKEKGEAQITPPSDRVNSLD